MGSFSRICKKIQLKKNFIMSFQEIKIVEDWKPASAPFNGQNELTRSDLNESENLSSDIDQNHVDIDISIGSVFMLKVKDNDNLMETAGDVSNISFDHEDKIHIKNEIKQEIKSEPLDEVEEVHDGPNDDAIKKASDISNIYFDHEDNIPIKKEMKQEIKSEPLDE